MYQKLANAGNVDLITVLSASIVSAFQCLDIKEEQLQQRIVDRVDILTDPVDEKHYKEEEVSIAVAYVCLH